MSTSDVQKSIQMCTSRGRVQNFKTFQTSQMTINHELHEQVHTMFYLSYTKQTYSIALVCMPYVFARISQIEWN